MRRYLVLSVLGVCLLVLGSGQAALAGGSTYYAGKNSQGQKLLFTVDHTATGPMFDPIFINQIDRCPVTGDMIAVEFSFQGFQIPIKNGKFNFVQNDLFDLLRWSGTVTSQGASGKESIDLAGFDIQGGLQDCGAGSLSWKAQALVPAYSATVAPGAAYLVKVSKASDGSVHYSVTH
jgi:hypothetical protein